jgi:hypothetical protein
MLADVTITGERIVTKREGQITVQYKDLTVKKFSACGM